MLNEGYKYYDAAADAMLVTQGYLMEVNKDLDSKVRPKFTNPIDLVEFKLEERSKGACTLGSLYAITYLQKTHPELFDYLFLMSFDNRDKSYGYDSDMLDGFKFHTVFLAKSVDGDRWFAGSPANFTLDPQNLMTNLMVGADLESIVGEINKSTPADWPDANVIERELANYQPPEVNDQNDLALGHSHLLRAHKQDFFAFTRSVSPINKLPKYR